MPAPKEQLTPDHLSEKVDFNSGLSSKQIEKKLRIAIYSSVFLITILALMYFGQQPITATKYSDIVYQIVTVPSMMVSEDSDKLPDHNYDENLTDTFNEGYRRGSKLQEDQQLLIHDNPDLFDEIDLGPSFESGALFGIEFKHKDANVPLPAVFINCGFHSDEIIVPEVCADFVQNYKDNIRRNNPLAWHYYRYRRIAVAPLMNPAGHEKVEFGYDENNMGYKEWRKAPEENGFTDQCVVYAQQSSGVDQNRNWPFEWGLQGCSTQECDSVYQGRYPLSADGLLPLSQYLSQFFPVYERENPYDEAIPDTIGGVMIDVHSDGNSVGYPWAGTGNRTPNHNHLSAYAQTVASSMNYRLTHESTGTGNLTDWAYGVLGVPGSLYFEISNSKKPRVDEIPDISDTVINGLNRAILMADAPLIYGQLPVPKIPKDLQPLQIPSNGLRIPVHLPFNLSTGVSDRAVQANFLYEPRFVGGTPIASEPVSFNWVNGDIDLPYPSDIDPLRNPFILYIEGCNAREQCGVQIPIRLIYFKLPPTVSPTNTSEPTGTPTSTLTETATATVTSTLTPEPTPINMFRSKVYLAFIQLNQKVDNFMK